VSVLFLFVPVLEVYQLHLAVADVKRDGFKAVGRIVRTFEGFHLYHDLVIRPSRHLADAQQLLPPELTQPAVMLLDGFERRVEQQA
jgi:hypothetical protein